MAAFGFHAGYAGAALALMDWAWQLGNKEALPGKSHYQHKSDLDSEVKEQVSKAVQKNKGKTPRVLIIGALGRCGKGVSWPYVMLYTYTDSQDNQALECSRQAGIPEEQILKWDMVSRVPSTST